VPVASRQELGESPIWPTLAVLGAAALYATLPTGFVAGRSGAGVYTTVRWVVPGVAILLLIPLALTVPQHPVIRSLAAKAQAHRVGRRIVSLIVIALLTAANGAAIVLLVHLLLTGAHAQASQLLRAGMHMWAMNVLVFALWFWQLDAGGPFERRFDPHGVRDFLFPQQTMADLGFAGWEPAFIDYLYVSFTNSTAFSPTDTMPLSRWAKVLMAVQSAASLLLAIMVVARAVNILH
jgi:uncharacterized membrane protein